MRQHGYRGLWLDIDQVNGRVRMSICRSRRLQREELASIDFGTHPRKLASFVEDLFDAFGASPPVSLDGIEPSMTSGEKRRFGAALKRAGLTFIPGQRTKIGYKSDGTLRMCRPDFVIEDGWVAVFFDGCYYHGCPTHCRDTGRGCRKRDRDIDQALARRGFKVVRVWEHEDFDVAAHRVLAVVKARQACLQAGAPMPENLTCVHGIDPEAEGGCETCWPPLPTNVGLPPV